MPLDALAPDTDSVGQPQLCVDARRAIQVAVVVVDLADALKQPLVLALAPRRRAVLPRVKARAADAQHAAHRLDRVLGPLRRDEPEDHRRVSLSFAKKAAAFLRISRSSVSVRTSRRSRRSSSRSSEVRPSALPSSTSTWRDQFLSDCGEHPSSVASCGIDRPLVLSSRTASRRNSSEYGGVDGMDIDPCCRARWLSDQVSTKPGELQSWFPRSCRWAPRACRG